MQFDEGLQEIKTLQKRATELKKEGDLHGAIKTLKKSLKLIKKSSAGFDSYAFVKILPYMQVNGEYSKIEKFVVKKLIPIAKHNTQVAFSHQNNKIRDAYYNLKLSDIYNKLSLCAHREEETNDKERFERLSATHFNLYKKLLEEGEQTKKDNDLELFEELFGSDISNWPKGIQRLINDK